MTTFLIVLLGWIFSLTLHEFAHALTAYLGGDYTVREKGYLTFNPLKYTHPVYSLLLPLLFLFMGGIGLPGGAVYIRTELLRNRRWVTAVSLAGPLSNIIIAIVLGLALRFAPVTNSGIWPGLSFLALLQISAAAFNLLPIPPFDGYGAIRPYLDWNLQQKMDSFAQVSMWVVLLVFWYVPFVGTIFWRAVYFVAQLLGVSLSLAGSGYDLFQFWR
jgi:Zn-dependent protease